jgi:membrane-associated phospholipid phosphatase
MWDKILTIFFCILLLQATVKAQTFDIEKSGDILSVALPVSAFLFAIRQEEHKPIFQFTKTMGVSLMATHSLKIIINKERPNGGNYSFPSGHTSAAFTGAAFIERKYGIKYGIPSYILASYVGWSRIYANKHDKWDVLGGVILGIGSAYIFTKPFKNTKVTLAYFENKPTLHLSIQL